MYEQNMMQMQHGYTNDLGKSRTGIEDYDTDSSAYRKQENMVR